MGSVRIHSTCLLYCIPKTAYDAKRHTFNPNTQEGKISVRFRLARAIVSSCLKTKQTKIHTLSKTMKSENSCRDKPS